MEMAKKLCLDLPGGKVANGQKVEFWSCTGLDNQQWTFSRNSYNIRYAKNPDMCLDAGDYDKNQGKQLILWECNGQPQQKWAYDEEAYTIYLPDSMQDASLCLDVAGQSSKDGASVDVWKCNGLWNQKFWVPPGYAPITTWQDNTLCIDLPGGKVYNGAPLQIWPCNNLASQMWWFGVDDWRIRYSYNTDYCIDAGNYDSPGTGLFLWECNDKKEQLWGYDANHSTIYLSNMSSDESDRCMDALGGSPQAGDTIGSWGCNGYDQQKWLVQWYGDGLRNKLPQRHERLPLSKDGDVALEEASSAGTPESVLV